MQIKRYATTIHKNPEESRNWYMGSIFRRTPFEKKNLINRSLIELKITNNLSLEILNFFQRKV